VGPLQSTRRRRASALGGLALAALAGCARPALPPPLPPSAPEPAPAPAPPAPAPPCARILWIEVRKSERRLEAGCEGGGRVAWTVALGRRPEGPKREEGDLRTPEGLYRISGAARSSRFHRFLPIDYPSREDAERARAEGRITGAEQARIAAAQGRGATPPANTPLGGHLGFHGEGARWRGDSAHLDWTYGCIAMPDDRIEFLAERALPGTPVRLLP
jgi:hypothetical protein